MEELHLTVTFHKDLELVLASDCAIEDLAGRHSYRSNYQKINSLPMRLLSYLLVINFPLRSGGERDVTQSLSPGSHDPENLSTLEYIIRHGPRIFLLVGLAGQTRPSNASMLAVKINSMHARDLGLD